jgi:predicted ATPase
LSLARLLVAEGRRDEAHRALAGVYDWFTEGFDAADLQDAKAFLEERMERIEAVPTVGRIWSHGAPLE